MHLKFIAAADRLYMLDRDGRLWLRHPYAERWEKISLPDGVVVVDAAVTAHDDNEEDSCGSFSSSTDYRVYIRAADGRMFQSDEYGHWSPLPEPR